MHELDLVSLNLYGFVLYFVTFLFQHLQMQKQNVNVLMAKLLLLMSGETVSGFIAFPGNFDTEQRNFLSEICMFSNISVA